MIPTRMAGKVPGNVERYINLYQSSNFLGGGDLTQGSGFHGHYASFNLKDRPEIIHINLDKFDRIQEQLAAKIRSLAATPARGEGEAVPLRMCRRPRDRSNFGIAACPLRRTRETRCNRSQRHITCRSGRWSSSTRNRSTSTLSEGDRIVVPRYLTPRSAQSH